MKPEIRRYGLIIITSTLLQLVGGEPEQAWVSLSGPI